MPVVTIAPGLCSITFRQLTPREVVALAVRTGIAGIEWGGDLHVPPGDVFTAGSVASMCRDAGVEVASYGSYLGVAPMADDELPGQVAEVLDSAEALGTDTVRVWTELGVTPEAAELDRARVRSCTRTIAEAAASRGITVALEFHPGTLTHTASAAVSLIEDLALPNLRTHWQPDPQLSAKEALDELRIVLPYLAHLHVFTWGHAGIADRRPLAEGADLWPAALALAETSPLPERRDSLRPVRVRPGRLARPARRGRRPAPGVDQRDSVTRASLALRSARRRRSTLSAEGPRPKVDTLCFSGSERCRASPSCIRVEKIREKLAIWFARANYMGVVWRSSPSGLRVPAPAVRACPGGERWSTSRSTTRASHPTSVRV